MPKNKIQLQKGLSLQDFQKSYGTEEDCRSRLFNMISVGTHVDISERKEMEKRLRNAQKMESIGNLAGGIAHDFNNILSPVVGYTDLLMEDLDHESSEYNNAQEIFTAGKRGSDLVRQILAFSRQSDQSFMPVRIQTVLQEVLKLSRATIPKNITIKKKIDPGCGKVMADASQIHLVVMNVITNAYHAVESHGGEISFQLRAKSLFPREGNSLASGRYVVLSIADTGHGIAPDLMSRIFDPYFTTKEKGKGTGLGLAVAYGIIKEHKGEITVKSDLGRGTTFDINLPVLEKQY